MYPSKYSSEPSTSSPSLELCHHEDFLCQKIERAPPTMMLPSEVGVSEPYGLGGVMIVERWIVLR